MELVNPISTHSAQVQKAFGQQALHFDEDDKQSPVLSSWRHRVYQHVETYIQSDSKILELNAGTGIDAVYFASKGHQVHATDASEGMISQIRKKMAKNTRLPLTCQILDFEQLSAINSKYDLVFSNFGGLNCTKDLTLVTRNLPTMVKPGGYVILVIMPPCAPWEWTWVLKGKFRAAFRRLHKEGAQAHLEGEYFKTYYYSLRSIRMAMGKDFNQIGSEGLGSVSPPPSATKFITKFPVIQRRLELLDKQLSHTFPFNKWADHLIVTFQRR